jgi:hypothetical protein
MPTWEDVCEIAGRMPEVEQATAYGTPALRVKGKFMCRLRSGPDALVARVLDLQEAEALVKGQPDVFFSMPHYDNYPYVLVHLDAISAQQLTEVVEDAWRTQAPKKLVAEFEASRASG